jgi:hypothetical protein
MQRYYPRCRPCRGGWAQEKGRCNTCKDPLLCFLPVALMTACRWGAWRRSSPCRFHHRPRSSRRLVHAGRVSINGCKESREVSQMKRKTRRAHLADVSWPDGIRGRRRVRWGRGTTSRGASVYHSGSPSLWVGVMVGVNSLINNEAARTSSGQSRFISGFRGAGGTGIESATCGFGGSGAPSHTVPCRPSMQNIPISPPRYSPIQSRCVPWHCCPICCH